MIHIPSKRLFLINYFLSHQGSPEPMFHMIHSELIDENFAVLLYLSVISHDRAVQLGSDSVDFEG